MPGGSLPGGQFAVYHNHLPYFFVNVYSVSQSWYLLVVLEKKTLENDVPGAKSRHGYVEEHTHIELKRWLECRGLKIGGNKAILSKR